MRFSTGHLVAIAMMLMPISTRAGDSFPIFEEIDRLNAQMAKVPEASPLSAFDPLLDEIQAMAKQLVSLRYAGVNFPPTIVFFCSDPNSMDCPDLYADDTIHLFEANRQPQFTVTADEAKLLLSSELNRRVEVYSGNTTELHNTGYAGLKTLQVDRSGRIDLSKNIKQGRQVLIVFGRGPKQHRLKFVWLMDGRHSLEER